MSMNNVWQFFFVWETIWCDILGFDQSELRNIKLMSILYENFDKLWLIQLRRKMWSAKGLWKNQVPFLHHDESVGPVFLPWWAEHLWAPDHTRRSCSSVCTVESWIQCSVNSWRSGGLLPLRIRSFEHCLQLNLEWTELYFKLFISSCDRPFGYSIICTDIHP